jgi:hypothetical protein
LSVFPWPGSGVAFGEETRMMRAGRFGTGTRQPLVHQPDPDEPTL